MASLGKLYLVAYNAVATAAWCFVASSLIFFGREYSTGLLWESTKTRVSLAQSLAVLEIIHCMLLPKLAKGNAITTSLQVFSRLQVVWILWRIVTPSQSYLALSTALLAWTCVELIRYPFYILNAFQLVPFPLKWLRYNAFIVLYPLGILSEVCCMVGGVKYFTEHPTYYPSMMPNNLNFELNLKEFYRFVLLLYVPGSVFLYTHMLTRRRMAFRPTEKQSKD